MQQLKNIVRFTGLIPNVPAQLPHGLQLSNGVKLTPDLLAPSIEGAVVTADDTNVFVTVNATEIDVYCEAWHTLERSFGNTATKELAPQPFVLGGGGTGGGPEFLPGRTLFVAKSWGPGAEPTVFFTTISAALVQAATMTPTLANPVNIQIFSGTYTEDLILVSNVHLSGLPGLFNTRIDGNITWTPGAGVNLPQTNDQESVSLSFLTTVVGSANTLLFDSATKVAGTVQLVCTECLLDVITMTSRPAALDNVFFYNCNFIGAVSITDIGSAGGTTAGVNIVSTRTRGLTLAGDATCRIQGGENVGPAVPTPIVLTGTASLVIQGLTINNPMTVGAGCSLSMSAGAAFGAAATTTLTVAAGGAADIRGANYQDNSRLIGPGTINRTTWNDSTGITIAGANPIAFTVPYPDPFYAVQLSLIAGPGNAAATISGRTGAGFTLNDAIGGNTFDYSIIRQ